MQILKTEIEETLFSEKEDSCLEKNEINEELEIIGGFLNKITFNCNLIGTFFKSKNEYDSKLLIKFIDDCIDYLTLFKQKYKS